MVKQYIDKSALVTELERRIDELCNYPATEPEEFLAKGASLKPLMELRLFLDTLEVKDVQEEHYAMSDAGSYTTTTKQHRKENSMTDKEKKRLQEIQNVPVDEEKLRNDRRNTV